MADSKDAKDTKDAKEGGDKPAAKKKNLKPLIMAGAAVVLLGGGAAAYFLTRPAPEAAAKDGAPGEKKDAKEKKKEGEVQKPFFVEFEPFTANMKDPEKFLQIKLTFQVKTADNAEVIKDLMPMVRAAVIPVLGAQDPAELMTDGGKQKLVADAAAASNKALSARGMDDPIEAVLITHMIIQ